MKRIIVLLALGVLAACEPLPEPLPSTPVRLSASSIQQIKSGVRASMRDPESAVFGAVSAAQNSEGVTTVCGLVNGRNGFGGMTGMVPYMGVLLSSGSFAVADIAGPSDGDIILAVCARHGIAL